ncbi:extracellular solute-binding protein [Amaricoccus macauensis]|uniref:extracellular solute-binding protein n=1 Tax=Amaricoccus macauensis TaxID=57001 RepID=UPI003C7A5156
MKMSRNRGWIWGCILAIGLLPDVGSAEPSHGIAMYGEPALPPDFVSLPYANPEAPKGGRVIFGEVGSFDSLNPYILKGTAPWGVGSHVFETLMAQNWDEPFTMYGLLAESIETGPERDWVEFTLRPEARFSDGSPVTVEDVIWSMETLASEGQPRYANAWAKVAQVEQTGPRSVRFTFAEADRELPLIIGLRPVLQKSDWEDVSFSASSLRVPTGSGPYLVGNFEPGRYIEFTRNPDYWGQDLPYNQGLHNFDTIRYEYFVDAGVRFQAVMAEEVNFYRETSPMLWETEYGFPAVSAGRIVLDEIPHARPSGMQGFVFNTRRDLFSDWQVREALIQAFNFQFINQTLNGGALPRVSSYFSNSELGMSGGAAEGLVADLLAPFADDLTPGTLEGYELPVADGSPRNRRNMRAASRLLSEAGWTVEDGVLRNGAGEPFRFEILISGVSDRWAGNAEAVANLYGDSLRQLGIEIAIERVDSAQYNERISAYDYDMIVGAWNLSLSPGNEQYLYWGSNGVETPGTRNYAGVDSAAVDALIGELLSAPDREGFVAAVRALDRVLTAGRYVVPFWFNDESYIAHAANLHFPEELPVYGDWIGWAPEVWWASE